MCEAVGVEMTDWSFHLANKTWFELLFSNRALSSLMIMCASNSHYKTNEKEHCYYYYYYFSVFGWFAHQRVCRKGFSVLLKCRSEC